MTEQPPQDEQEPREEETEAVEAEAPAPEPVAEEPEAVVTGSAPQPTGEEQPAPVAEQPAAEEEQEEELLPETPRVKPEIPGADLIPDIVLDGEASRPEYELEDDEQPEGDVTGEDDDAESVAQPISDAMIDLAAGARYAGTGKRKTSVARVILKPGDGTYVVNGKTLEDFFPRATLQRNIRQPLEAVGYDSRMDVVAKIHGGGVSSQAGALRHGISRALILADPNLRGELKRRGFLTRDPRVKERKKAGLKKARKRPQFSKR